MVALRRLLYVNSLCGFTLDWRGGFRGIINFICVGRGWAKAIHRLCVPRLGFSNKMPSPNGDEAAWHE